MPTAYIYLIVAVFAETIGTSAMQASQQFTRLGPTLVMIAAYAVSFYLLGHTLKYLPVGITYAIWSGLGIVFIAAIGYFAFNQRLDLPAVLGMGRARTGKATPHGPSQYRDHRTR